MLESGSDRKGQSQGMVDAGRLPERSLWCSLSRRHCIFFILVLGAVLFVYNTNIQDMMQDLKPTEWWSLNVFQNQRQNVMYPIPASRNTKKTNASVAQQTTQNRTENMTSVNMTQPTSETMSQQKTELPPPPPVPYKSPGPYLVEYPYKYSFLMNEPQRCEQENPFVVLVVPVAPHNRAHRDVIRSTWGAESLVQGKVVKLFFLLGLHAGVGAQKVHEQVLQESREHHDLIQSNFLDCYKNLTIKTMVMLEWLDAYCSSATYAMKIDSDMFLNVPNLVKMLLNAPKKNYMTGLVARGAAVLRDRRSKWCLPVEVYAPPQYPRYALGLGYVLSLDLPKKLVEASRHVKAVYIEDVYLGLCMQYLGIPPTDPPDGRYFHVFPAQYSRCTFSKLIATTTRPDTDQVKIWKDFKRPGPYC
ncbi:beta-1,3-galactosyltransferase 2-like [Centropristis striata]|uniref:beta-1,3-galactosyltransferase 2-like n=1 Tax=Centropristis striata TaxID=184440 RepID=UPI0027DF5B01|nr:beta-1,3-galactosyltransferase 2-like [Centropristis striata]